MPDSQVAIFVNHGYQVSITERDGEILELTTEHCRHTQENATCELKCGFELNHLSSKRIPSNDARAVVRVMVNNLACWAARINLGSEWRPPRPLGDGSSPGPGAHPLDAWVDPASPRVLAWGGAAQADPRPAVIDATPHVPSPIHNRPNRTYPRLAPDRSGSISCYVLSSHLVAGWRLQAVPGSHQYGWRPDNRSPLPLPLHFVAVLP